MIIFSRSSIIWKLEIIMNAIITLIIAALTVAGFLAIRRSTASISPVLKALVLVYCLIGFVRYFLSDSFVEKVLDGADIFESLLRMFYHVSYATLPMAVFYKRRIFRNIAVYFNLPAALVAAVSFDKTFAYFLAPGGGGYYIDETLRLAVYMAELVLAITIPALLCLSEGHRLNVRSLKEWALTPIAALAISWMMMPAYLPQSLVGFTGLSGATYGNMHLGWILYMVLECVVIYLIFKRRTMEEKHELCVFLTIAQMYHTMSVFLRGFTFSRIPLQLCCIAAFLYFIAIVLKSRYLFDFCYVSNMIGAFIAIAIAAFSPDALCFWNVHYMQEHTFVVVVPVVAYSLHLYPRLDRTAVKYILSIFTVYFIFCLVVGGVLNTVASDGGGYTVNYFYMFNQSVAVDYVPFAGFTGAIVLNLFGVNYYPILIVFIYCVFILLCMLFYYANRAVYAIKDRLTLSGRAKAMGVYKSAIKPL